MGWDFKQGASKADIVKDLVSTVITANFIATTVAHKVVGQELWRLVEFSDDAGKKTVIVLDLLSSSKNFGWGYKEMDEAMGPYYYKVPKSFLDRAPVTNPAWRARVLSEATRKAAQKAAFASLKPGDRVRLDGCMVDEVEVLRVEKTYFVGKVTVGPTKNISIGVGSVVRVRKDFILVGEVA